MNRLQESGTRKLIVWYRENDEVVRRLLTKLDFGEDMKIVEMAAET
jgi:hypothetical protein